MRIGRGICICVKRYICMCRGSVLRAYMYTYHTYIIYYTTLHYTLHYTTLYTILYLDAVHATVQRQNTSSPKTYASVSTYTSPTTSVYVYSTPVRGIVC